MTDEELFKALSLKVEVDDSFTVSMLDRHGRVLAVSDSLRQDLSPASLHNNNIFSNIVDYAVNVYGYETVTRRAKGAWTMTITSPSGVIRKCSNLREAVVFIAEQGY